MLNSTYANDASKIVNVLDGGVEFYQQSMKNSTTNIIRAMFQRMVEEKQKAIAMMRPFLVNAPSKNADPTDWHKEFEGHYSPLLDADDSISDADFISHLQAVEEKVMDVVEATLNHVEHSKFATELRCIRTRMQQCRDEMQSLKEAVM